MAALDRIQSKDAHTLQLRAQVLYKLSQYKQAIDCYEQIIDTNKGSDDAPDIATNLLACSANQFDQIERVEKLLEKLGDVDRSYEYFFN